MDLMELKNYLDSECRKRGYDPANLDFKKSSTLVDELKKYIWENV